MNTPFKEGHWYRLLSARATSFYQYSNSEMNLFLDEKARKCISVVKGDSYSDYVEFLGIEGGHWWYGRPDFEEVSFFHMLDILGFLK